MGQFSVGLSHMARAMFLVGVFIFVCLFWMTSDTINAAVTCQPPESAPYVSFTANPGQPRYDNSKSKNRLRSLNRTYGQHTAGWSPIGLTLADRSMRIAVTVRSEQLSDGSFCSNLSSVEATVEYNSIDVYIANIYERGSCQYSAILDHERRHVGVFNDTLMEFAPRIERRLYEAAGAIRPQHSSNHKKAAKVLQDKLERAVNPMFDEFDRVLARRNGALDTEENYREELKECPSW